MKYPVPTLPVAAIKLPVFADERVMFVPVLDPPPVPIYNPPRVPLPGPAMLTAYPLAADPKISSLDPGLVVPMPTLPSTNNPAVLNR